MQVLYTENRYTETINLANYGRIINFIYFYVVYIVCL